MLFCLIWCKSAPCPLPVPSAAAVGRSSHRAKMTFVISANHGNKGRELASFVSACSSQADVLFLLPNFMDCRGEGAVTGRVRAALQA